MLQRLPHLLRHLPNEAPASTPAAKPTMVPTPATATVPTPVHRPEQKGKSFQKQDAVFVGFKHLLGMKSSKRAMRYWRNVGLYFAEPEDHTRRLELKPCNGAGLGCVFGGSTRTQEICCPCVGCVAPPSRVRAAVALGLYGGCPYEKVSHSVHSSDSGAINSSRLWAL